MPVDKCLLEEELVQREEEGCAVHSIRNRIAAADPGDADALASLLAELEELLPSPDLAAEEPSDLPSIKALRPDGPHVYPVSFPEPVLRDRIAGAWLGRAAGCLLGKPCEGWHHDRIKAYLQAGNLFPLDDYFPRILPNPPAGLDPQRPANWLRGNISGTPRDDDTDYTILGLHILEENGIAFTTEDVAAQWLNHLPYWQVYTAERVAYANLVNGRQPPASATYRNPYREWIGAQIRADTFGYVNPGRPEKAADMAYRDAALSHVKNGIYGEMWVAACLAAAFVESDPRAVLEAGLREIPRHCRLAEALQATIAWAEQSYDWEQTWARVNNAYGHYHVVHTINNACAVALALIHGSGDFERTVSIAVMCGWDTDCNGATAGSIIGTMLGAAALPDKWIVPLHDSIESSVQGFSHSRISDLAERTLAQAANVLAEDAD
ncbi:MAG: ADP-ribosylglycohydrolase family protein [Anaerolineae bacterium]